MARGTEIPLLLLFLVFALFPISSSYSQEFIDKEPTLGIAFTDVPPFIYQENDGKTVIFGEVENRKNFPIGGIKIMAYFYDDLGKTQTTIGTTIMEVIPPLGKSPYMIKSETSNSVITRASVNFLGFNSLPEKKPQLKLQYDTLEVDEKLLLTGTITNKGELSSINTKIQLISYDELNPPTVLGIYTINLKNNIVPGESENFEFEIRYDSRAADFKIVGESNEYSTGLLDIFSLPQVPTSNAVLGDITPPEILKPIRIEIPTWLKNVAAFWCEDKIDDTSFIEGIQYLIDNEVVVVSTTSSSFGGSQNIPSWVKDNACWWSQGLIGDEDFASGLQFLISQGIIQI